GFEPWLNIFKTYYPNEPVDTISFISMGGSLAIAETLKRLGNDITRERFLAELEKLKGFDPGVQASALNFSQDNHSGVSSGKMIYLDQGKPLVAPSFPTGRN